MTTLSFVRALPFAAAVAACSLTPATTLLAQMEQTPPVPQIVITAQGEVQVTPDRSRVSLGVETEAKTAQEAAQANAALQTRILESVRRAGIPAASIRTTGYNVAPKQEYLPETRRWRVDGYRVSNIVVVTIDAIAKTGEVMDAALSAGANRVAGIEFEVKDPTDARERAITLAVERARREAEIGAKAAGGQVLGLLQLDINSYQQNPRPMMEMARMSADASSTPVSEGTQSVVVSVTTRWQFGAPR